MKPIRSTDTWEFKVLEKSSNFCSPFLHCICQFNISILKPLNQYSANVNECLIFSGNRPAKYLFWSRETTVMS